MQTVKEQLTIVGRLVAGFCLVAVILSQVWFTGALNLQDSEFAAGIGCALLLILPSLSSRAARRISWVVATGLLATFFGRELVTASQIDGDVIFMPALMIAASLLVLPSLWPTKDGGTKIS